jgi:hypothetical protein
MAAGGVAPVHAKSLKLVGTYPCAEFPLKLDICVAPPYLHFLAAGTQPHGKWIILNVADPSHPVPVVSTTIDATRLDVSGQYACVSHLNSLRIFNVKNPASPKAVGTYELATLDMIKDISLKTNRAYLALQNSADFTEFKIIDLTRPAHPSLKGTYKSQFGQALGVFIKGAYAYLADPYFGLIILDISNPALPKLAGSYPAFTSLMDVWVSGNYVYLLSIRDVKIVDVKNPKSAFQVGCLEGTNAVPGNNIVVSGNYAFVSEASLGLTAIDISDRTSPKVAAVFRKSGARANWRLCVNDPYVYLTSRKGVFIFKFS